MRLLAIFSTLRNERSRMAGQLNALDIAIRALSGNTTQPPRGRWHMSAAAKAKISASKKAWWAKRKGGKVVSIARKPRQRLLDLRDEESLRMRAVAKPIITSTPAITSTNVTGRDYPRVQRTPLRNLHSRIHRAGTHLWANPKRILSLYGIPLS